MENRNSIQHLIGLIDRPAFCVKDEVVLYANRAASNLGITEQMPLDQILGPNLEGYKNFQGGALYCALTLPVSTASATITRIDGIDYFVLDVAQDPVLNAMALASQQLRKPLTDIIALMDSAYMQKAAHTDDGATPISQLNKSITQIHRQICNMSDVCLYTDTAAPMHIVGICGLIAQAIEKASVLLESAGFQLEFERPDQEVYTLACGFFVERSIYNLISNAVKFAPKGTKVLAHLEVSNDQIRFSIQSKTIVKNPQFDFDMYRRVPSLEDPRHGLGLGLVMIRKTATLHGGTVLIDYPESDSVRITMTMMVRDSDKPMVRNASGYYVDYSGGMDHALLELADIISHEYFKD